MTENVSSLGSWEWHLCWVSWDANSFERGDRLSKQYCSVTLQRNISQVASQNYRSVINNKSHHHITHKHFYTRICFYTSKKSAQMGAGRWRERHRSQKKKDISRFLAPWIKLLLHIICYFCYCSAFSFFLFFCFFHCPLENLKVLTIKTIKRFNRNVYY